MVPALGIVRAIRRMCAWCRGNRVQSLECLDCPLDGDLEKESAGQLLARMRAFCLSCAGSAEEVAACGASVTMGVHGPCALHPFRFGRALRLRQLRFLAQQPFEEAHQVLGGARQGRPGKVEQVDGGKEPEKDEHGPELGANGSQDAQQQGVVHGVLREE